MREWGFWLQRYPGGRGRASDEPAASRYLWGHVYAACLVPPSFLRATRLVGRCQHAPYIITYFNTYTHREVVCKNEVETRPFASLRSRRTIIVQRRDAKGRVSTSASRFSHVISRRVYVGALYTVALENLNPVQPADWPRTTSINFLNFSPKIKRISEAQKKQLMDSERKGAQVFFNKWEEKNVMLSTAEASRML